MRNHSNDFFFEFFVDIELADKLAELFGFRQFFRKTVRDALQRDAFRGKHGAQFGFFPVKLYLHAVIQGLKRLELRGFLGDFLFMVPGKDASFVVHDIPFFTHVFLEPIERPEHVEVGFSLFWQQNPVIEQVQPYYPGKGGEKIFFQRLVFLLFLAIRAGL